jgi:hypothetical protein
MIGLLFETERCLDGLRLDADGYLRPASARLEAVRIFTNDLADPMVIRFVNTGDADLLPFMSQCSAGDVKKPIDFGPGYEPHVHIGGIKGMQLTLRKCLIDASGPNPIEAFIKYGPPEPFNYTPVKSTLRLYNGKPQLLLESDELHDFMRLETQLIALEGAKVVVCEQCENLFLTGPGTGRRIHAVHCSDKCRVGATRARKKENQ